MNVSGKGMLQQDLKEWWWAVEVQQLQALALPASWQTRAHLEVNLIQ